MNKKFTIFLVIAIAIIIGIGGYLYFSSKNKNSEEPSYETSRTSTNENSQSNTSSNNATSNDTTSSNTASNNTTNQNTSENITSPEALEPETKTEVKETEIASFTTKIYSKNDSDRQNNLTVSCSTLNDTIVENGSTFSFCGTLGKTSDNKGYEKATVFKDGKEVEAMGGGICQVSSTLYNAIKKVPNIDIVERHNHSGEVYYVPEGQDAAVAYGTYDFKFTNNSGNSLKIKAKNTKNNVTIKILKLE